MIYIVDIPRAVRMVEWEEITIQADNKDEAIEKALGYVDVIGATIAEESRETELLVDEIICEEVFK